MMDLKKILIPYDGSKFSNRAFKEALDLAQKYDSKIIILSCLEVFSTGWFGKMGVSQIVINKLRGKIMKEIQELEKIAKKKDIPVKARILESTSIAKTIVSFAKLNKIDLIIMGSKGQSGIKDLFLGSVSNGVVHQAKCPVLIIK